MANFGVRAGYVWRGVRNQYGRYNINRPFSAFTVPVSGPGSGPGRPRRQRATTARRSPAFDLAAEFRALPPVNQTFNVDDSDADFHTFEITGTKRMSNRWSLLASYGWTKSFDNATRPIQGNTVRQNALPATPNDVINTDDGRQCSRGRRQAERHLELAVLGHLVLADAALPAGRSRSAAPSPVDAGLRQGLANLSVFIFVMTGVVYETQRSVNPHIADYADALYFTVTALTTTGLGTLHCRERWGG